MDLYYAMTNYHILCCILHKLVFGKDKKAILWISSYLLDNQPGAVSALKESAIFDDVLVFNEVNFIYHGDVDATEQRIKEEQKNIRDNSKLLKLKILRVYFFALIPNKILV